MSFHPLYRRIAAEHGVDLSKVKGPVSVDAFSKKDVLAYIENSGFSLAEKTGSSEGPRPLHSESPYRPEAEPAKPALEARLG